MPYPLKKLGELFEITSSKRVFKSEWKSEGVPFYRAREIVKLAKNEFVGNDLFITEKMFEEYSKKYGIPQKGDIMVTGVGTLGICYLVKEGDRFYFKDGNIIWLKHIGKEVDSRYIEYGFQSDIIKNQVNQTTGTSVGTYTIVRAKNTEIPLPPLPTQKAIVQKLDTAFEKLDASIQLAKKNLENVEELGKSVLEEVFGSGEYEEKSLSEVSEIINGGTPKTGNKDYWDGDICWITPKDMGKMDSRYVSETSRTISKIGLEKSSARIFPVNSVILSSRAPIGHLAINTVPMCTNQGCKTLVPGEYLETIYLYYFLLNSVKLLNELGSGTTFKELSGSKLKEVKLPFPPLEKQKEIVEHLDRVFEANTKLKESYEQKIASLQEMKQSLLREAFEGRLVKE